MTHATSCDSRCKSTGCNEPVYIHKAGLCKRCYRRAWAEQNADAVAAYNEARRRLNQAPLQKCRICGATYQPGRRDSRYCSRTCKTRRYDRQRPPRNRRDYFAARTERQRLERAAARLASYRIPTPQLALPRAPSVALPCARCGSEIRDHNGRGGHRRYCTNECAKKAAADRYHARARPRRTFYSGRCHECGMTFITTRPSKFCANVCERRNRRRRHKGSRSRRIRNAAQREPLDIVALAARDNWRCHICGKRVTRKTWSMDHLIPLSAGGSHTYDNVALAHHLCNSRRGATGAAQLRLMP
jgi:5-methylcytosine-specific restriction endonuclease McrA